MFSPLTFYGQPGTRVSIEILGVPSLEKNPFCIFGLFQHEHKISVQHYKVQRDTEYGEPIKSKASFISLKRIGIAGLTD